MGNKSGSMKKDAKEEERQCNYNTKEVYALGEHIYNIEIYGAQGCPTEEKDWHCAKKSVLKRYLDLGQRVLFFDDSKENVDAASELRYEYPGSIDAKQVVPPRDGGDAGYLVSAPEVTMWDYVKDNGKYNVIVFDFDLTLSDKHSGGTTLTAVGPEHDKITIDHGLNKVPFMNSKKRHGELIESLINIAKNKTLVILSRGGLGDLVNAFSKMGFNVIKAVGMGFEEKDIVLTTNNPITLLEKYNKEQVDADGDSKNWNFSDDDECAGGGHHKQTRKRKKRNKKSKNGGKKPRRTRRR